MTVQDLELRVAQATGEPLAVIQQRGFHLADPAMVTHDPEPNEPRVLDWDTLDAVELFEFYQCC